LRSHTRSTTCAPTHKQRPSLHAARCCTPHVGLMHAPADPRCKPRSCACACVSQASDHPNPLICTSSCRFPTNQQMWVED
jgi:hypothetical protein